MIETRPLLSMFLTALLVVTMSGCDTFDNPLRWEQSPIADNFVGTWKETEGRDAGLHARVWRADDKTLGFEVTSPDKPRTTFLANVLTSDSVHVLQVRMDSYKEFDEDGGSPEDQATGFYFVRIAPSEHGVNIHDLDVDTMGRVAEKELAASDVTIPEDAYARCLRDSIRDRIWKKALLAGLLSEQQAEAIKRESARSPEARIDPYPDMERLRTCLAHRLPSESLDQLFLEHADEVFSGETSVFLRE